MTNASKDSVVWRNFDVAVTLFMMLFWLSPLHHFSYERKVGNSRTFLFVTYTGTIRGILWCKVERCVTGAFGVDDWRRCVSVSSLSYESNHEELVLMEWQLLSADLRLSKVGIVSFPFQVSVCNSMFVLYTSAGHLVVSNENPKKVLWMTINWDRNIMII